MEKRLFKSVFDQKTKTMISIPFNDEEMAQYERIQLVQEYNSLVGIREAEGNYSEEELEQYRLKVNEIKWNKMREKRNQLLTDSDYVLLGDVWSTLSPKQQNDFLQYRKELRDLPSTITDINNVIYPEKP